jgi:hypothetical protein
MHFEAHPSSDIRLQARNMLPASAGNRLAQRHEPVLRPAAHTKENLI